MWITIIIKAIVALCGLANLMLAVYVYKKNTEDRLNKSFFYFGFFTALWCFSNFIVFLSNDIFWIKLTYAMSCPLALSGVYFTYALSGKEISKWFSAFIFSVTVFFTYINLLTPLSIKSVTSFSNFGFETITGPLIHYWEAYFSLMVLVIVFIPLSVLKQVDEQRRRQILYFLTGETIFATWGIFLNIVLPALGINEFLNLDSPATIFLVGFTSYAIIKYHLLGISSLFFQAFIYSLVIISIIASLLLLMFGGSYLFAHAMIWPLYVIVIVVAIVLFFIGRLFFMEKRDLEKAKINLTEMLELSEKSRTEAETERDKTVTIINSFSDGLIILNEKNEISSINPEAERILEIESSKLFKKQFKSLENFPKAAPVANVLTFGFIGILRKEIEIAKDYIVELSVIPLNLSTTDIGHLIVLHDVSREKMVEKMKSEFVSLAAHQLRTPLTVVNWSMSMLKKGEFGKLTNQQVEVVDDTLHNNERLISLVNNLLNVTRIEEGRYLYEMSLSDMREVVKFVVSNYSSEIKKKKVKILFEQPKEFPQTMIDTEKIKIAVQNLIDNAIKYSPESGNIIISLDSNKENITFRIQDFGMGIPKGQQGNIFKKFFRGDNAAKMDTTGSGLGLFLTENIINAHGGKIWFESEEGVGTNFYFNLPIRNK